MKVTNKNIKYILASTIKDFRTVYEQYNWLSGATTEVGYNIHPELIDAARALAKVSPEV